MTWNLLGWGGGCSEEKQQGKGQHRAIVGVARALLYVGQASNKRQIQQVSEAMNHKQRACP